MKNLFGLLVTTFALTGCLYGQCINGPCALEHSRIVKNIKPYGAHWIRGGMTKESRLNDIELCGRGRSESAGFPQYAIKAETLPTDTISTKLYDQNLLSNPEAENRLAQKWSACMRSKGYVYLEQCDDRCLYP